VESKASALEGFAKDLELTSDGGQEKDLAHPTTGCPTSM